MSRLATFAKKTAKFSFFSARRLYATVPSDEEKKIRVDEYEINYLRVGSGPLAVLLMPGALGSIWTDFGPQIKGLDRNAFTVVAWDPPGYGKSVPPNREYPIDFFRRDAITALNLMRALELPKFSVLGWSDGGISSIILAAENPVNVTKAVIWGANSHIKRSELEVYESMRDLSKWSDRMKDPFVSLYGREYFSETWNKWCDGMKNIFLVNRGDICMSLMAKVKCPTLILHGEKDSMVHKEHAPMLRYNIPNSQYYGYPEGKHNIHLRYAEDFNKRVTEFLVQ